MHVSITETSRTDKMSYTCACMCARKSIEAIVRSVTIEGRNMGF